MICCSLSQFVPLSPGPRTTSEQDHQPPRDPHILYKLSTYALVLLIQNVFRHTSSGVPEAQGEKGDRDAVQARCA